MLPVAPFTIVNARGRREHGIGLVDYLIGTALGMAPGIVMLTLLGTQLAEVLTSPQPREARAARRPPSSPGSRCRSGSRSWV